MVVIIEPPYGLLGGFRLLGIVVLGLYYTDYMNPLVAERKRVTLEKEVEQEPKS
jgi:hypothetical protein